MQTLFLVARIVLGAYYLFNALNHFTMLGMMSGYAASKGVPAAELAVIVAGLLLLVGGLSIITGYKPTIGVIALVIFLVPVTFIMHNFWVEQDQMMRLNQMVNFLKNIALLASAVMFLAIPQPWPKSVGAKRSHAEETQGIPRFSH
jgi:putative oxidoreductase